jgi:NAD(P)-dependent dehydrogenase (short-subunit alcohol dehydrogenase family)
MKGKVIVITGANAGIGKETTRALALKEATIVMACRNLDKARPVCEMIKDESGNLNIEVMHLDLAWLDSIRIFADQFMAKYRHLDVLINNAGTFSMKREETRDGFENTMGVNYLGPFLLTNLLLPVIKTTPNARIINLGSDAHYSGEINIDDLQNKKAYFGFKAYANSRLATVFFTQDLAERLAGTSITVNALHPGHVATGIWNLWPECKRIQSLLNKILKYFMISPEQGAQTSIYLATSDDIEGVTGKYFDRTEPKAPSPKCMDKQLKAALWQLSADLVGLNQFDR